MIPIRRCLLVGTLLALTIAGATPALAHQGPGVGVSVGATATVAIDESAHMRFHERMEQLRKQFLERLERLHEQFHAEGSVRARVEGRGRARARGLAGEIQAIDGTKWTVDTRARGDVQVDVSEARVRWPGRPNAVLADFKAGDHVNIQLARVERERGARARGAGNGRDRIRPPSNEPLKARAVHFVAAGHLDRFRGTVTAVSSASLTVAHDSTLKTFTLNSSTTVRVEKELTTIASIKVGDKVRVVTREGESLALIVRVDT